ncbi:hypothetical protein PoB_003758400 [Plakobranchus ocellatus]|uniref:TNFR-Cys domain-containing protein n=1 Tax=Plakobranchus ocellatus TaxID=259542 RepID=A0AAV4AXG0_9GAST|nr:hypothetical protein PoB_003758400 [Plakobranchus ocellatus]
MTLKWMEFSKYTLALLTFLVTALCLMHCEAKTWESCPEDYYIDLSRNGRCSKCTPFDDQDPYQVLDAPCTPYHDTIISCVAGFYYEYDSTGNSCHPCSTTCPPSHPFLRQECFRTMDRICCKENETIVRNGKCEKLVNCTVNEYMALDGRQTNRESCKPCPPGFENAKKKHRDFKCQKKEEAIGRENHNHRSSAGTISNHDHRSSAGTISNTSAGTISNTSAGTISNTSAGTICLMVPLMVIVMHFY